MKYLRKQYEQASLSIEDCQANPIDQFKIWWNEALDSAEIEPNAMCLSTVNTEGVPSSRIVLIKGLTNNGFLFYTNYASQKGKELESGKAALNFHWKTMERQIRIRGSVSKISKQQSEDYFHSRPRESQISAYASPQSAKVKSKRELVELRKAVSDRFLKEKNIPLPDNWGGYELALNYIEFWQGRPDRFHDRICYELDGANTWQKHRLAP